MEINHSDYTIAELVERFKKKELVINRSYQRSADIWPDNAKIYFIDTILENYPFPKVYLYQTYDRARKKPVVEVVDGQQRLMTIIDFMQDKFKLSNASKKFSGYVFSNLPEDVQDRFAMYRVQSDVILAAERPELLEMFRRMNAYTAALNYAEKRHSIFQGKFKWFVLELADEISPILEQFGILTPKQIIRMADAEMISELVLVLEQGLINRSEKSIDLLYRKYDEKYEKEEEYSHKIKSFFDLIKNNFGELKNSLVMKPYAVHSLFSAYAHIRFGIPNGVEDIGIPSRNLQIKSDETVINELLAVSSAHETKDVEGRFRDYVIASSSTTTKQAQRKTRTRTFVRILDPA